MAATGLVAYRAGGNNQRQLTWVDRSGTARGTVGDPDATLSHPNLSPVGRRVVVDRMVQGNQDLWLLDGARTSRVTFDPAQDTFPLWSPDGTRIAFRSSRTGRGDIYQTLASGGGVEDRIVFRSDRTGAVPDLYQKLASGAGVEERIVASDQSEAPTNWSADGSVLLYSSTDPQQNGGLWVVPMVGDRTPSVFLETPFREAGGAFSPDGRWVAYHSNESGRNEIYVRPFVPPMDPNGAAGTVLRLRAGQAAEAAGGQWQVSTAGGISPVWRPDGKELYYLNPAGAMMAAPIAVTGPTLEPDAPVVLFPTRIFGGGVDILQGPQSDVARDGRFLINTVLDSADAPITLLQNWRPPTP